MDFPQRRKKAATYGKASRNANYKLFADAPSPEKPRVPKASWTGSRGYNISSGKNVASSEATAVKPKADPLSIFDMPSSDEELTRPPKTAVRKPPAKKTTRPVETGERVFSEDSASEQLHKEVAAAEAKRLPRKRSPSVSWHAEEPVGKKISTSERMKPPGRDPIVLIPNPKREPSKQKPSRRAFEVLGTSGVHVDTEIVKERPTMSLKSTKETNLQKREQKDPQINSSPDEFAGASHSVPLRPAPKASTTDTLTGMRTARLQKVASVNSSSTQTDVPASSSASAAQAVRSARARRNELKPTVVRPVVSKGKSAPTLLQRMLPSPETKPSSPAESPISPPAPHSLEEDDDDDDDDDDGDDVPTPATPPARTSKSPFGTVTPKQHKAWCNLLEETETASPSALSLSDLKITQSIKPRKIAVLQRSSSDVTHAGGNRRRRLIDTLKQDKGSDEDSDDDETMADADNTTLSKPTKPRSRASLSSHGSQHTDPVSGLSQETSSSQNSAAAASGPKLTYARTRSYLNEASLEDELLLGLPTFDSLGPPRRPQPQNDLDDIEESGSSMRTIHELRAAGTARRVVDDLENLLDDIEDKKANSLSRRRSALMELCTKLTDKSYVGRMVDHSLDSRLFHFCGSTTDPVLGFLVACAMRLMTLAETPKTSVAAMHSAGCLRMLAGLLKLDTDITRIAKERRTNMSKVAQSMLSEFRSLVVKTVWPDDAPQAVSPRAMALEGLESVVRKLRESGNTQDLLGYRAFADVVELVKGPAQKLSSGSASSSDIALLELTLSILESGSLNAAAWTSSSPDAGGSIYQLARSVDAVISAGSSLTESLEALALRLSLNLTNNNAEVCAVFASQTFVQHLLRSINNRCRALGTQLDEEEHMKTLDRLILSLGAMINLAEFSNEARLASVKDGDGLLNSLVRSFLEGMDRAAQADSMEESQSSVAYGYLAVLLGNLCQTWAVKEKIRNKLPQQRLNVLIVAIEQFLFVHQKVDKEAFEGEEGREVWANYTARLQGVIDRLQGRAS